MHKHFIIVILLAAKATYSIDPETLKGLQRCTLLGLVRTSRNSLRIGPEEGGEIFKRFKRAYSPKLTQLGKLYDHMSGTGPIEHTEVRDLVREIFTSQQVSPLSPSDAIMLYGHYFSELRRKLGSPEAMAPLVTIKQEEAKGAKLSTVLLSHPVTEDIADPDSWRILSKVMRATIMRVQNLISQNSEKQALDLLEAMQTRLTRDQFVAYYRLGLIAQEAISGLRKLDFDVMRGRR